jgi:hypothetical protein
MADAIDALYQDLINTEQIQGKIREKATSLGVDPICVKLRRAGYGSL